MSAIFNFQSLLSVILLLICTCAYIRSIYPSLLDNNKTGLQNSPYFFTNGPSRRVQVRLSQLGPRLEQTSTLLNGPFAKNLLGIFWKAARIGERKSPYVALCCLAMAGSILFWQ